MSPVVSSSLTFSGKKIGTFIGLGWSVFFPLVKFLSFFTIFYSIFLGVIGLGLDPPTNFDPI